MIYRFGPFAVDADRFELTKDGREVAVEPQVLSVILHLLAQRDHVVSRDELVEAIWHGRAISDAAIASRIKSARHVLGDNGNAQAVIRTIHGRGFRFVAPVSEGEAGAEGPAELPGDSSAPAAARAEPPQARPLARRTLLAAGALGAAALAGGVVLWRGDRGLRPVPPQVAPLVMRAREAMAQNTRAGQFQAIGIFRRVAQILPDYADGWGMLGMAYGIPSHYSERSQSLDLRRRGAAAARRALALERGNGFGELALGILVPFVGDYFARREHMRRAVAALPGNEDALTYQAVTLQFDGFPAAAVDVYRQIAQRPMPPALYNNYIRALWSAGRTEEADQALTDALALYPTQNTLWFTRFHMLLHAGRADEAQAQLQDRGGWPAGISPEYMRALTALAAAFRTREPALVEAVAAEQLREARHQSFEAEMAIRTLSGLGRVDEAFVVAQAYHFGRGFVVPDFAALGPGFSPEQRQTRWLFEPVTAPMRRQ